MKAIGYLIPKPDFKEKGEYKATKVDEMKNNADMLITACNGGSYTISTKGIELSGRGVKSRYSNGNYEVTEKFLSKLREAYNIMTDF